jgi:hypothetical protein
MCSRLKTTLSECVNINRALSLSLSICAGLLTSAHFVVDNKLASLSIAAAVEMEKDKGVTGDARTPFGALEGSRGMLGHPLEPWRGHGGCSDTLTPDFRGKAADHFFLLF